MPKEGTPPAQADVATAEARPSATLPEPSGPENAAQPAGPAGTSEARPAPRAIDPQRLLRIAGVAREVLEEARRIRPDAGAVDHLRRFHVQITSELQEALPPELWNELDELTPEVRAGSLEELAMAHSEILGWLEGLFQGTQLAIQVQAARALEDKARRRLPPESVSGEPDTFDSRYL